MTLEERFWAKVNKNGPVAPGMTTPCWIWTGSKAKNGYGRFGVNGRLQQAHRFSYEQRFGPLPPGHFACHHCDVKACVNYDHLFGGTNSDNQKDAGRKGRCPAQRNPSIVRGERGGAHVMTAEQVAWIRRAAREGKTTATAVAKQLGVHLSTVQRAASGDRWPDVTEPPCRFPHYNPMRPRSLDATLRVPTAALSAYEAGRAKGGRP